MRRFLPGMAGLLLGLLLFSPAPGRAEYQSKGKRDPFVPLLSEEGKAIHPPGFDEEVAVGISGLVLQGIVFDPKADSYAVINGKIVRRNDEIEGMKILRIEPREVIVLSEGQQHHLTLRWSKETEETQTP